MNLIYATNWHLRFLILVFVLSGNNINARTVENIKSLETENGSVLSNTELDIKKIILLIDSVVDLSKSQQVLLTEHFITKKEFFSGSDLSEVRKEAVLLAFRQDFENILSPAQLDLLALDIVLCELIYNNY